MTDSEQKNSSTTSTIVTPSSEGQSSIQQSQRFNDGCSEQSSVNSMSHTLNSHDQNGCKNCHYHYSASFFGPLKHFLYSLVRKIKQISTCSDKTNDSKNQIDEERRNQKTHNNLSHSSETVTDEEKSGYFHIEPKEKAKSSPQDRVIAVLMISVGTLMALAFVLVGLGKAARPGKNSFTSKIKEKNMVSSATPDVTGYTSSAFASPTSTIDTVTKLIIVNDGSILSKIITESEITVAILPTPI
ncbi:hypothetical protein G6F56_011307 [Rhizopus delemar]|nr:hypothetical protein G6F56_011307 [Rhizopus delemar]